MSAHYIMQCKNSCDVSNAFHFILHHDTNLLVIWEHTVDELRYAQEKNERQMKHSTQTMNMYIVLSQQVRNRFGYFITAFSDYVLEIR